jgi:hypothetical protein
MGGDLEEDEDEDEDDFSFDGEDLLLLSCPVLPPPSLL